MGKFEDAPKDKPTKINEFITKQKNEIQTNIKKETKLVQTSIYLPVELHKQLLLLKATESIKIKNFVIEAIQEKIQKYKNIKI